MLTIAQAANGIDGVSEHFIRKLCVSGQLECVRAGKKILISEDRLNEFMFGIPSANKKTAAAASTKSAAENTEIIYNSLFLYRFKSLTK